MKLWLIALCALLTACGGGGSGSTPGPIPNPVNAAVRVVEAMAPSLYKAHGIFAAYKGLEATALVENGLVRLWYTSEDLLDPSYAPGQANYGTTAYPFRNIRIAYMEMAASAFQSAVESGQPLQWTGQGDCVPGLMHSSVAKGPDGAYYLTGATAGNTIDLWKSVTGYPGTWSLVRANIAPVGIPGNTWQNWSTDHWDVWVEYQAPGVVWKSSYWTGPTLDALVRQDSNAAPAMQGTNGTTTSAGQVLQQGAQYVRFAHDSLTPAPTPTDIAIWSAPEPGSGWTQRAWVLQLATVKTFAGDPAQPFNSDSQLADPTVIEINGHTFMVYETIRQELYDVPSLSVAWWPAPLATVVSNYLGAAS